VDHNKYVILEGICYQIAQTILGCGPRRSQIEVLTSFMKLPRTLKFPKKARCNCQNFNEKYYTYVICANVIHLYNMKINNDYKNINLSLNIASLSFF
jgi:hypothetical protein